MKISYLGCASLGEVTPIEYGELTNLLFWQITNADKKDGFFLEFEAIKELYTTMMSNGSNLKTKLVTKHQIIEIVSNYDLTELTIHNCDDWSIEQCRDMKELQLDLQIEVNQSVKMLLESKFFIKKLFRIITAIERNLFQYRDVRR